MLRNISSADVADSQSELSPCNRMLRLLSHCSPPGTNRPLKLTDFLGPDQTQTATPHSYRAACHDTWVSTSWLTYFHGWTSQYAFGLTSRGRKRKGIINIVTDVPNFRFACRQQTRAYAQFEKQFLNRFKGDRLRILILPNFVLSEYYFSKPSGT